MNGPVSVIMYVRWGSGVRLGTTSSERAIPRHSEIQTSVLSVFRVKYLYHYLCTICRLALIASKGCRHSAEIISETPSPDRCLLFSTKRSRRNQPDFSSRSRATADILIAYESSLSIRTQGAKVEINIPHSRPSAGLRGLAVMSAGAAVSAQKTPQICCTTVDGALSADHAAALTDLVTVRPPFALEPAA